MKVRRNCGVCVVRGVSGRAGRVGGAVGAEGGDRFGGAGRAAAVAGRVFGHRARLRNDDRRRWGRIVGGVGRGGAGFAYRR